MLQCEPPDSVSLKYFTVAMQHVKSMDALGRFAPTPDYKQRVATRSGI